MKRILFCGLLFVVTSFVCVLAVYGITRYRIRQELPFPNTEIQTETTLDMEGQAAMNQQGIQAEPLNGREKEYCLVSEAGFLLVFNRDRKNVCLYTHIPVTDFPEEERARLMEGIWFPAMLEVYQYLESYTS